MRCSSEKPATFSWVVAGREPLKPILVAVAVEDERDSGDDGGCATTTATTPTAEGSRISAKLPCPPPPRKRKTASVNRCNNKLSNNGKKEFFITPDLETVFIRRHISS